MAVVPLASAGADRNLLFGILALQMDFITRDQLVAGMNAWVLEKSTGLGDILLRQGALRQDIHAALAIMVDKHLEVHGNDAQRSLQALGSVSSVRYELRNVADADVQASVSYLPDETRSHQPPTIGLPTSAGTRFRILRPHAKGGLGQVFVAQDEELHREVALKEIQEHSADNPVARCRFVFEAEVTGGLEHPGIVPVYGLGQYPDGRPFYAMRFIRGDSLKAALERFHQTDRRASSRKADVAADAAIHVGLAVRRSPDFTAIEFRQLLGRFVDVCNAVAYAHSRGVLHRDLKPGNIMLGKYGETLIVDWGLAKSASSVDPAATEEGALVPASSRDNSSKTQAGTAIGTPPYMSPEQALGRLDLMGPASDIYSLGATLYVVLTGEVPFPDKETGDILQKVQRGEFMPPRRLKPNVPAALDAICLKAMALRPEDRYATALDLAADIEHWLADDPVRAYREPWTVRWGRWMRKHKPVVSGLAAAFLVSVIGASAATVWYQREQARQEADAVVRQAEADQRRNLADQSIRTALDQAQKARAELQATLHKPGGVFALLNEPARWEAQVQAARAAIERAKAVLANASDVVGVNEPLRQIEDLVRQDDDDRNTALALEKIRLDRSTVSEGGFDNAGAARAYPELFIKAGFAIFDNSRDVGARIVDSAIKDQWVAALDDWAGVALRVKQYDRVDLLMAMARDADPDPEWRDRIRQTKVLRDPEALAESAKKAPADKLSPQLLMLIVNFLPKNRPERESLLRFGLLRYPGDFWLNLQMASDTQASDLTEAIGFVRTALAVRPHSAAAYNNLALMLGKQRRLPEAMGAFEKALQIEPKNATMVNNLAGTLREHKKLKEALAAVEKAVALNPKLAIAHNNLGSILGDLNRPEESLAAHQKAVEFDPDNAEANNNLGVALKQMGRKDEAIAAYQKTLALDPRHATAWSNLSLVLHEKRRYTDAAEAAQKAIDINPKSAFAHNHLGMALDDLNRYDEAVAAFRKSIELKDDFAEPYYNLGLVFHKRKRWDDAVAAHKKAVELLPDQPHRLGALGQSLLQQGSFAESLAITQKAIDLVPGRSRMLPLLQSQLSQSQAGLAKEKRLVQVVDQMEPATTRELLELARLCQQHKQRHLSALRLYRQAIQAEPALLENASKQVRYNAACAAALTGMGIGPQAAPLTEGERQKLRREGHDWLQAELGALVKRAQTPNIDLILNTEDYLRHWQNDDDLAGIREPKALDKLPSEEKQLWQKLWADVKLAHTDIKGRFRETTFHGVLSAAEKSKPHVVPLTSGKRYVLELHSADFDTLLRLDDPKGNFIAENDDITSGNLNSRLVFQAPADGMYRILATSFEERGIGSYTLRIREVIP